MSDLPIFSFVFDNGERFFVGRMAPLELVEEAVVLGRSGGNRELEHAFALRLVTALMLPASADRFEELRLAGQVSDEALRDVYFSLVEHIGFVLDDEGPRPEGLVPSRVE